MPRDPIATGAGCTRRRHGRLAAATGVSVRLLRVEAAACSGRATSRPSPRIRSWSRTLRAGRRRALARLSEKAHRPPTGTWSIDAYQEYVRGRYVEPSHRGGPPGAPVAVSGLSSATRASPRPRRSPLGCCRPTAACRRPASRALSSANVAHAGSRSGGRAYLDGLLVSSTSGTGTAPRRFRRARRSHLRHRRAVVRDDARRWAGTRRRLPARGCAALDPSRRWSTRPRPDFARRYDGRSRSSGARSSSIPASLRPLRAGARRRCRQAREPPRRDRRWAFGGGGVMQGALVHARQPAAPTRRAARRPRRAGASSARPGAALVAGALPQSIERDEALRQPTPLS